MKADVNCDERGPSVDLLADRGRHGKFVTVFQLTELYTASPLGREQSGDRPVRPAPPHYPVRLRSSFVIPPPILDQCAEMRIQERGRQKQCTQSYKCGDPVYSPELPDIKQV